MIPSPHYNKLFILIAVLIYFPAALHNAIAADAPAGKVIHVRGNVEIVGKTTRPAAPGQILYSGEIIRTGKDGWISILLADETLLQLNKNSRFSVKEVSASAGWNTTGRPSEKTGVVPLSKFTLDVGEGWFRNKNINTNFSVQTPVAVTGVRGTEMDVKVWDDKTLITVLEGMVDAANELGSLSVRAGEQAVASPGMPLSKTLLLTPEDAVQWTIPIPPAFDDRGAPAEVQQAMIDLRAGDVSAARQKMGEFTALHPDQAAGWNLLAVTHIMLGRNSEALRAAERAVQAAPDSASSLIVHSYAFQAAFDLDRAEEALLHALRFESENILALINLARLQFGMDRTEEALLNLEKARRFAPSNAEVHNLQGFLFLAARQTDDAAASFRRALELDPSLAEPHMGLGLAYMRKGDTPSALEEISTAVLLDPRRSLFLSYWGKMLYQLERFDKALDILKTAGQLDPRDPTPEFYRAIVLRDLNRPTEAIKALNRAMELNDNRAVYRSRFLLDSDLAVKNIDLSVLYNQLGLSAWAQNKAAASVKRDYANASGHLFLAGALSAAEDRSWPARGEYLLARLLIPANMNTFNTFNEYTTFFEKPAIAGTLSTTVGNKGSRGGDVIAYGAVPAGNVAFGTMLSYHETDGWRDTNGDRGRNIALFGKWDASPKDSLMAVFSHQITNQRGPIPPSFEYDSSASPQDWLDDRLTRMELGWHRHFSPQSDLLIYLRRTDERGELGQVFSDPALGPISLSANYQQPHYQAQAEYLFKVAGHQLILGTTQYRGDNDLSTDYSLLKFNVNIPTTNEKMRSLESYFLSDIWRLTPAFAVEGSLHFDHMQNSDAGYGTEWHLREWSPRIGIVFTPNNKDTFRLAAFRYLLPFNAERIDPMDVAGVPIYRNAFEGTLVEEADAVWEREWSNGYISLGFYYLEKKYNHLVTSGGVPSMQTDRGSLKGGEIVLNQLLGQGFGLAGRYRYQDVSDESNPASPALDREDHLASLSLKYLHHSGFSSSFSETYRRERFKATVRESENIWISDGKVGYEFPGKRGSLNLEIRNIFNQRFNWVTDYFVSSGRTPGRETLLTLSLNF